jgi:hypothetical protein
LSQGSFTVAVKAIWIAMAEILIYWPEIENGDFPDCCMTCGCEDTELVPRRLETFHYRVLSSYRRFITVDLPFCRAHRSRPWIRLGRTDAQAFTDEGVVMRNVAPVFVEEMEAFRDEEDDYEERRHRRKHKKKGRKRKKEDREDDREPFSDARTPHAPPASSSIAVYVLLGVVLVPVLFVGTCCVGSLFLPGVRVGVQPGVQRGPAFNNNNNRPPFGPGRFRRP